ncbi:hypothetical protein BGZ68_003885 [Mortierella alpina]|nr:hypothetical protein BGZ68_003885 [Mortierella alpina]
MRIATGIITAFCLAAGVSAQFPGVDGHGSSWKIPVGLGLYPCIDTCQAGQICREHGFAKNIRACGRASDWKVCKGFCVIKGQYEDEANMKPKV